MTFTEIYRPILSIRFSENLSNILGADADVSYNHANARTRRKFFLMEGNVNSVYVYCNIMEHVTVGDTKAPLLRIVNKPEKNKKETCIRRLARYCTCRCRRKILTLWK